MLKPDKELNYLKNLTILYAEDDEYAQQLLPMILEDYIGNVITVKNGQEALKVFRANKIDLLITDILMPKINGIELAKTIKEEQKGIDSTPIIFATAFTDTEYLLDSIKLRCDGYVLKPINVDNLLEVIHSALLPRIQLKEILSKNMLLEFLDIFMGDKKLGIIKYILEHCDSQNIFYGSHDEIANSCDTTRPTVAKTFQQLIDLKLLVKIRNKTYHINTNLSKINTETEQQENVQ